MPTSDVKLIFTADGSQALAETKRVEAQVGKLSPTAERATRDTERLTRSLKLMGGVVATAFAVRELANWSKELARATDQVSLLNAQAVKLSGGAAGFDDIYQYAQRLGVSLQDAGDQLNAFTPALGKLGIGFSGAARFAEDMNRAMRVYGVRGAQAASVTTQLSQALSSGDLAGEELKALRENAGGLAMELERAIQQALGTTESLKELGSKGKLSSRVVYDAWSRVFDDMRSDMKSLPQTLEQQEARFANAATRLFAAIDSQLRISDAWKWFTGEWAEAMESVASAIEGPQTIGRFGAWDDAMASLDDRMADLKLRAAELEETLGRAWGRSAERAQQALIAVREEMAAVTAQREIYINLAAEDAEVERAVAAARAASSQATVGLTEEAAKAAAILSDYMPRLGNVGERLSAVLPVIEDASRRIGIPKEVIISVAALESGFRELAASGAGAIGMMQFIDSTAEGVARRMREQGVANVQAIEIQKDANTAILAGAFHLQELTEKYGNLQDALIAYNAGPKWVGTPFDKLPRETQKYLEVLIPTIKALSRELDGAGAASKLFERKAVEAFEEIGATEPSIRKLFVAVEDLADQYLPAERDAARYAQVQAVLNAAVATGTTTQERANEILEAARGQLLKTTKEAEKMPGVLDLWSESLKELGRNIQNTIGDAFYDLFSGAVESAADAMDRLKEVVLRSLADLAAAMLMRPLTVMITGTIAGGAAAGTAAAQSSVAGLTGTSGTGGFSFGGIGNLLGGSSIGTSMAGYAGTALDWIGVSPTSSVGGAMWGGAANLATVPNWAFGAGAIGGSLLGSALFSGGQSGVGSSVGSTAGTILGAAVGGPVGALIGGALGGTAGGWLGSLFGGDKPKDSLAWVDLQKGWFNLTGAQNFDPSGTNQAITEINDFLTSLAGLLGPQAEALRTTWSRPTGSQVMSPNQIESWLMHETQKMVEGMISVSGGQWGDMVKELWAQSGGNMDVFAPQLEQLKAWYDTLPQMLDALRSVGIDLPQEAAISLMGMAGGIDSLLSAQQNYLAMVYTEEEKLAMVADQLRAEFARLGYAMPETREDLRALVAGLDLTSQAGQQAYISIMGMTQGLIAYYDATQVQQAALAEEQARLVEEQARAVEVLNSLIYTEAQLTDLEIQRAAEEAREIGIRLLGIDVTRLSVEQFAIAIDALGGVGAAVSALGQTAIDFVNAAQSYYSSMQAKSAAAALSQATAISTLDQLVLSPKQLLEKTAETAATAANAIGDALGIDVTSMSQTQFAEAVQASGGTAALAASLGDQAEAFASAATTYYESQASLAALNTTTEKYTATVTEATHETERLSEAMLDWVQRLRDEIFGLMGFVGADAARVQYYATLSLAQQGSPEALARLTSDADAYLQAARVASSDRLEYIRLASAVASQVELVAEIKSMRAAWDQYQRDLAAMADTLTKWDDDGMPVERV